MLPSQVSGASGPFGSIAMAPSPSSMSSPSHWLASLQEWFRRWSSSAPCSGYGKHLPRFDVPDVVRPGWFRWMQMSLAVAGIAVTFLYLVHLIRYTLTGLVWRHWRATTIAFAIATTAWTTLWLLDRLVLDGVLA